MANNYTQASFKVPVKDSELTGKRLEEITVWFDYSDDDPEDRPLSAELFGDKAEEITEDLRERRRDHGSIGFDWQVDSEGLYLSHDESIDMESAVLIAQILLDLDDNDAIVQATWADACSKARLDEFGGGAVAFNRHTAEWHNTYDMARELAAKLERGGNITTAPATEG